MTELQVQRMKEIMVFRVLIFIVLLCFNLSINCSIGVAQSAASLLADNTKGFFCIRNVAEFQNKWAKTQLGLMAAAPQMDGFASDLQKQLQDRMLEEGLNISITWHEIQEVCRQELCFALMLPDDGEGYAVAMVLDVTGNVDKAKQLVARMESLHRHSGELPELTPWDCPKCGESVDGTFDICWKCQFDRVTENGDA